jgi:MFS family permease
MSNNKDKNGESLSFQEKKLMGVTVNIIIFGLVSLFTDFSTDMVDTVLPLFLLSIGANFTILGLISGVSTATGNILKGVSGWLSDKLKKRKKLVITGYSLSNISKPLIAVFPFWETTLVLKFADRVGKGVRTSPRDAIIADSQEDNKKTGSAFGFHRALDTLGAILGPITAFLLIGLLLNFTTSTKLIYQIIIGISIIPGLVSVVLVIFARDIKKEDDSKSEKKKDKWTKQFILLVAILAVAEFASIDLAFFIARSQDFISYQFIPLIVAISNISYVVFSLIGGKVSDKVGRKIIIILGLIVLLLCSILLMFDYPPGFYLIWFITLIFILFGVYHGLVDPVSRAMVSDVTSFKKKGKAYGLYYLIVGLVTLPESIIFGFFYDFYGHNIAFLFSSIFLFISIVIFALKKFR